MIRGGRTFQCSFLWVRDFNLNFVRFICYWRHGSPIGLPSEVASSLCHCIFTIVQVLTVPRDYLNKLITPRHFKVFGWDISATVRTEWDVRYYVPLFLTFCNFVTLCLFHSLRDFKKMNHIFSRCLWIGITLFRPCRHWYGLQSDGLMLSWAGNTSVKSTSLPSPTPIGLFLWNQCLAVHRSVSRFAVSLLSPCR